MRQPRGAYCSIGQLQVVACLLLSLLLCRLPCAKGGQFLGGRIQHRVLEQQEEEAIVEFRITTAWLDAGSYWFSAPTAAFPSEEVNASHGGFLIKQLFLVCSNSCSCWDLKPPPANYRIQACGTNKGPAFRVPDHV